MDGTSDRTERASAEPPADTTSSEDERAREMIARIARQVDLEMGRLPLEPSEEAEDGGGDDDAALASTDEPRLPAAEAPGPRGATAPGERSEEDVSRELVERIAHEVDEERRG